MWHTAANPGNNAWFEVDLGKFMHLMKCGFGILTKLIM